MFTIFLLVFLMCSCFSRAVERLPLTTSSKLNGSFKLRFADLPRSSILTRGSPKTRRGARLVFELH